MNKPFLLSPAGKDYLWGGDRLKVNYGKNIELTPLAETWECSTHPDGHSIVRSGEFKGDPLASVLIRHPEYIGTHPDISGLPAGSLPIMVKLIDASADLSVQVHPDDNYAYEHEDGNRGKTEMWYVLDSAADAKLIYGLKWSSDKDQIRKAVDEGRLSDLLQEIPVHANDVFYVRAGTIHAIGAGTVVAEIQESSNITYRLYDYDRTDKNGKKRSLHMDKALDVADLEAAPAPRQPMRVLRYSPGVARELLGRCKYFEVYRMLIGTEDGKSVPYRADELSFRVLLCYEGSGEIRYTSDTDGKRQILAVKKGDCIFIPADSVKMNLTGQMQLLDIQG